MGRSSLPPEPKVRKVLIYRLGSLGDTLVALPCFHLIERMFPGSERVLLTNFPVHAKAPAAAAVRTNRPKAASRTQPPARTMSAIHTL